MRMTGKQEKEIKTIDGEWLYDREYECPKCGRLWWFSVNRNLFHGREAEG
jgi:acetone carboxylase gamma subunit